MICSKLERAVYHLSRRLFTALEGLQGVRMKTCVRLLATECLRAAAQIRFHKLYKRGTSFVDRPKTQTLEDINVRDDSIATGQYPHSFRLFLTVFLITLILFHRFASLFRPCSCKKVDIDSVRFSPTARSKFLLSCWLLRRCCCCCCCCCCVEGSR